MIPFAFVLAELFLDEVAVEVVLLDELGLTKRFSLTLVLSTCLISTFFFAFAIEVLLGELGHIEVFPKGFMLVEMFLDELGFVDVFFVEFGLVEMFLDEHRI